MLSIHKNCFSTVFENELSFFVVFNITESIFLSFISKIIVNILFFTGNASLLECDEKINENKK